MAMNPNDPRVQQIARQGMEAYAPALQQIGPEAQTMMPPNMAPGFDPAQAMIQPPPPDPAQLAIEAQVVILQTIIDTKNVQGLSAQGGDLNLDVFANAVNTLATAYKTLRDADQQQGIPPELQLEMEQQRLDTQLQIEQARLKIEQERAALDLELKRAEADVKLQAMQQQAQLKYEQAQVEAQLKAEQAAQDAQIKQQNAELDLATKEDKHLQEMSMREQQAEMQASQSKDKQG